jgi:hypothetical protein
MTTRPDSATNPGFDFRSRRQASEKSRLCDPTGNRKHAKHRETARGFAVWLGEPKGKVTLAKPHETKWQQGSKAGGDAANALRNIRRRPAIDRQLLSACVSVDEYRYNAPA